MQTIRGMLKKGDIVLIVLSLFLFAASFFLFRLLPQKGRIAVVSLDNRPVYLLSLSEDCDLTVSGPVGITSIRIRDGALWITGAPCPHKDCQRMGKISRAGEIIVCIPNKIFIAVEGNQDTVLDGITM
jgi:hypothetical protein